jgi:WD40 repeat protein
LFGRIQDTDRYTSNAGYKDGRLRGYTSDLQNLTHLVVNGKYEAGGSYLSSINHEKGLVISGDWDGHVRIWDTEQDTKHVVHGSASGILSLVVTSKGFVTGHYDGSIKRWLAST